MKTTALLTIAALSLVIFGCKKDEPVGADAAANNVSISVKTSVAPVAKISANTLTIESAKILLKSIKFEQASSDDSLDVKTGMIVVNLNLANSVNELTASRIPAGVYDEVRFTLHKPEDTEAIPDPEFRDGTSGNQRYSVIVRGTFNGVSFVYKSLQNASQEISLSPPITVTEKSDVNVTLVVDAYSWFRNGGDYVDPNNSSNARTIDDAIKAAFRAFKDENKDGEPD
jgi:hypothetical protein